MLHCVELAQGQIERYRLPFAETTPRRLHDERMHTSKIITYQTQSVYFPEQAAAFSLKCSLGGSIHYLVDGRRITVEQDRYLLVNSQRPYASYVEQEASAVSVFFGQPLVADVLACQLRPDEQLLDAPWDRPGEPFFFENLAPRGAELAHHLKRLLDSPPDLGLREQLHQLLQVLLSGERAVRRRVLELPAVKAATRWELHRRVARTKDLLESRYTEGLTLDDLALEACMAPHHFLRTFGRLVGRTPHQHQLLLRMERARKHLEDGLSVAETALAVGFDSWEHFSRSYKKTYGHSPSRTPA